MFRAHRSRGQGLVEFALVIPVLLLALLSIIEGALLFQSFLAIQHAAREAARFAVTYQPPQTIQSGPGPRPAARARRPDPAFPDEQQEQWIARRVAYIKDRAIEQSMGIRIVERRHRTRRTAGTDDKSPWLFWRVYRGRPDDVPRLSSGKTPAARGCRSRYTSTTSGSPSIHCSKRSCPTAS